MSIIQTVKPEAATGEVAALYKQMEKTMGRVPTPFQMYSSNPFLLKQQVEYIGSIMAHPTLSMPLTTCIRMLVSKEGDCQYCIGMNAGLLMNMAEWTVDQVSATQADFNNSPLSAKEKTMLALVLKMTHDPHSIGSGDLQKVRDAGWTDSDILDAVNHGARMVAGDILINGFKVERDY